MNAVARAAGATTAIVIVAAGLWFGSRSAPPAATVPRPTVEIVPGPRGSSVRFVLGSAELGGPDSLDILADRGKLLELVLVRASDLGAMTRLHTGTLDSLSFITALPPLPTGEYHVYASLTPTHASARTSVRTVTLPGEMRRWRPGSPLDITYTGAGVGTPFRFEDGSTLSRLGVLDAIVAGRPIPLRFTYRGPVGTAAPLERFDGSIARAIALHADGSDFTLLDQAVTTMPPQGPGMIAFSHTFAHAGKHRLWVQLRTRGKFRSAAFDITVSEATR